MKKLTVAAVLIILTLITSCIPTVRETSATPEPSTTVSEPGVSRNVTIAQLVSQASTYNGTVVTLDTYYFDAIYKSNRLADAVSLDTSGQGKVVPVGEIIFLGGWLPQELRNQLYTQEESISPTNTEYFGKLRITGKFNIDDINDPYIEMSSAEVMEWTPPRKGTAAPTGNLQIKIEGIFGGKPLQGAEVVSSKQPDGQPELSGLTDAEGKVTFDDIKQGSYEFTISLADYIPMIIKLTVTGGRTASPAFFMAHVGEAPDGFLMAVPGNGSQYNANIQVQGWANPWPPIVSTTVTLGIPPNAVQINYRDYIETEAGQVRNNLFYISRPGSSTDDPQLEVTLAATGLPSGLTVTQASDWGRGYLSKTALQIGISQDVPPGEYSFGFDVEINGQDYGTVPCTIKVTEFGG